MDTLIAPRLPFGHDETAVIEFDKAEERTKARKRVARFLLSYVDRHEEAEPVVRDWPDNAHSIIKTAGAFAVLAEDSTSRHLPGGVSITAEEFATVNTAVYERSVAIQQGVEELVKLMAGAVPEALRD